MTGRNHYKGVPEPLPIKVNVNAVNDGPHLDAFARQRFSEPFTLFDSAMNHNDKSDLWSAKVFQNATATYQPDRASMFLTVGTSSGDRIYRQTKQYIHYQPGKSQLVLMTGVFASGKTGLAQKIGYFDDDNGLFFELYENEPRVCVRSSVSGSPVDSIYAQSTWNLDNLLGGGPSRIKLDATKAEIFVIDFEWLGVGRIRFGFVIDGQVIYCHEINNANVLDSVFMSDPANPCRYEIENFAATSSSSTLEQICSTVAAEGGYNPKGLIRGVDRGVTDKTITPGNTYALLSVRLNSASYKSFIEPLTYVVLTTSKDNIHVELTLNGTLNGSTSWQPIPGTGMEYDISATTVSGGKHVWADYTSELAGGRLTDPEFNESLLKLATTASGVADVLTLSCSLVGAGTADVIAGMNIKEVI
jgi:hypothetical protein